MSSNPAPALNVFVPDNEQTQNRFGVDVSTPLDGAFTMQRGIQVLAQRLVRRFSTQRNFLTFHQADGLDVRAFLSKGMTNRQTSQLQSLVEEEAKKDEQVDDATAVVRFSLADESLSIQLSVLPSTDAAFTMTVLVTQLDVKLLKVGLS